MIVVTPSLKKYFIRTVFEGLGLVLVCARLLIDAPAWVGLVGLTIFGFSNALVWRDVIGKIWREKLTENFSFAYGLIFQLFILSSFWGSFILFGRLTDLAMFCGYVIVFILAHVVRAWLHDVHNHALGGRWADGGYAPETETSVSLLHRNLIWPFLFFILWVCGGYFLTRSSAMNSAETPWQIINQAYLPIFFVLTFICGIILASKYRSTVILLYLVAQSLLLHWYLPASHVLPWGGDVWRHIAVENRYLRGDYILPVISGPEAKWREVVGIDLPEALVIPNKFAYAQFWGTGVAVSDTLGLNPITFNKYFLPILWSFAFTLLLYRLGLVIFGRRRAALLLAAGGISLYSFQASGSFTLPNPFAFLFYLLVLITQFSYLREHGRVVRGAVFAFSLVMVLVYPLYAIAFWTGLIVAVLLRKISLISKQYLSRIASIGLLFLGVILVPVIDLIAKYSHLPTGPEFLHGLKQAVGNFSGWFLFEKIRTHDIEFGNIIFNQPPSYAYVASAFDFFRLALPAIMLIFWLMVILGFWRAWRKNDIVQKIFCWLSAVGVGGYFLGNYILQGQRIFSRRLDLIFALATLVLFLYGTYFVVNILRHKFAFLRNRYVTIALVMVLISVWAGFTTFTYGLGPDMKVAAVADLEFAQKVVSEVGEGNPVCVLADTWPLLVLEGVSARDIVGGGFPMDLNYGQSERVAIYSEIVRDPSSTTTLQQARNLTKAAKCWVYVPNHD